MCPYTKKFKAIKKTLWSKIIQYSAQNLKYLDSRLAHIRGIISTNMIYGY